MEKSSALAILCCLLVSCRSWIASDATELAEIRDREKATELASKIHEHMGFDEISKIVPLPKNTEVGAREHGGTWFDVPIGQNYIILLRFERSSEGKVENKSTLNSPPLVKRRET